MHSPLSLVLPLSPYRLVAAHSARVLRPARRFSRLTSPTNNNLKTLAHVDTSFRQSSPSAVPPLPAADSAVGYRASLSAQSFRAGQECERAAAMGTAVRPDGAAAVTMALEPPWVLASGGSRALTGAGGRQDPGPTRVESYRRGASPLRIRLSKTT